MDYDEFLYELDKLGYGLVASNTYLDRSNKKAEPVKCIYIMVAQRGSKGMFYKEEGKIADIRTLYNLLLAAIGRDIGR